jgi:hypothetical protein
MINGYRNRLTKALQWVLFPDDNYCGQSYCYEIIEDNEKMEQIKGYQDQVCKISVVTNVESHYVLVCNDFIEFYKPGGGEISEIEVKRVIDELGGSESAGVVSNLILNSFESYEEFQKSDFSKYTQLPKSKRETTQK